MEKKELFKNILQSLDELGVGNDIGFSRLCKKVDDKGYSQEIVKDVLEDLQDRGWIQTSRYNHDPVLCCITNKGRKIFQEILAQEPTNSSLNEERKTPTEIEPSIIEFHGYGGKKKIEKDISINEQSDCKVFFSYNSKDHPQVHQILRQLNERDITCWLDNEEIRPGSSVIKALDEAMRNAQSIIIFIGPHGLGKWQDKEAQTSLHYAVSKKLNVIPVLLPGITEMPKGLLFLKDLKYVSFKHIDDKNALEKLIWGITGVKPGRRQIPKYREKDSETEPVGNSDKTSESFFSPPLETSTSDNDIQVPDTFARSVEGYDVFVSYNSKDAELVNALVQRLRKYGIKLWIAEEQIPPGRHFIDPIEEAMHRYESAMVILGTHDRLGYWQRDELRSLQKICKDQDKALIPVLLPDVDKIPQNLSFLITRRQVKFKEDLDEEGPLQDLIWGITGVEPRKKD